MQSKTSYILHIHKPGLFVKHFFGIYRNIGFAHAALGSIIHGETPPIESIKATLLARNYYDLTLFDGTVVIIGEVPEKVTELFISNPARVKFKDLDLGAL